MWLPLLSATVHFIPSTLPAASCLSRRFYHRDHNEPYRDDDDEFGESLELVLEPKPFHFCTNTHHR